MRVRSVLLITLLASTFALPALPAVSEEDIATAISPRCQRMMMIGCALTKGSKGRNAPAANKECADMLAEGECSPPPIIMPQKIVKVDTPVTSDPEEDDLEEATEAPVSKREGYAPPAHPKQKKFAAHAKKPDEEKSEDTTDSVKADEPVEAPDDKAEATKKEIKKEAKEETKKEDVKEEVSVEAKPDAEKPHADKETKVDAPEAKTEEKPEINLDEAKDSKPAEDVKPDAAPEESMDAVSVPPKELIDAQSALEATSPTAMENTLNETQLQEALGEEVLKAQMKKDAEKSEQAPAPVVKELKPVEKKPVEEKAPDKKAEEGANFIETAPLTSSDSGATDKAAAEPAPTATQPDVKPEAATASAPETPVTIPAASLLDSSSQPMSLAFGTTALIPDQPNKITLYLRRTDNNSPVTLQDLKEVHTSKLHLLIIDPSLKEYHHVHPEEGAQPGEYTFNFTPTASYFRVFADVTTIGSDQNHFIPGVLGVKPGEKATIDTVTRFESSGDNVNAVLSFDGKLTAGAMVTGTLRFVDSTGAPVKNLEPVMGAFAHIVAFSQDLSHVLHVHPLGTEPSSPSDRGGPDLQFHFEPEAQGFVRLYAQIKVAGKDIFIPFGFRVQ